MHPKHRTLVLLVALAVVTSPLFGQVAQTPRGIAEDSVADGSFGLGNQDHFVLATAFQPYFGESWRANTFAGSGYFQGVDGVTVTAPLTLPAGARITVITCYFHDEDPAGTMVVRLTRYTYNTSTETPGSEDLGVPISSVGAGGFQRAFETFDETVRYRPSLFTRQHYALKFFAGPSDDLSFRGCNVTWNRQVTPTPATATFADVPVGHPYHQFVEALAGSGITGGCGGGLYCVNAPITRGEMAVFLAAALGLHFPN